MSGLLDYVRANSILKGGLSGVATSGGAAPAPAPVTVEDYWKALMGPDFPREVFVNCMGEERRYVPEGTASPDAERERMKSWLQSMKPGTEPYSKPRSEWERQACMRLWERMFEAVTSGKEAPKTESNQ